ncbi:AIPR family protein [Streptomyces sp. ISID311]|uniref:AIPR family protein n=1 Tax=Streptomyces sp. ISID311 TaxID=2601673 RepID=UPI0021C4769A|nr:AIPR family protein [Streptomyces sp. ISID311]
MSVALVRPVRRMLEDRFGELIDLSDVQSQPEHKRHEHFLTRALAAMAVQMEHQLSDVDCARAVFDGGDDRGLDAIAIDRRPQPARICLVQAKWSENGKGKFGEAEVHKMVEGLDLLLDLNFSKFNRRFQPHAKVLEECYDGTREAPKITLVLALMRSGPLGSEVRELLERKIKQFNDAEEMVDYKVLDLRDFRRAMLGDAAAPKVNTTVRLEGFGHETTPYKAYYGTMTVPEIAELYGQHRRGLFARNIRDSLDLTDVNVKIRGTLTDTPEHFWYFSNGITMLCERMKPTRKAVTGGVGDFLVEGASVVNGAQTVSAIYKAYDENPEVARQGRVLVRLISLEDCPPGFGDQVTTNTNTQNPIEERDFKSLDPVQSRLRDSFSLDLRLTYVIKRGEQKPDPERGCTISEAAEALAAVHPNAEYAALAKRDLGEVWEDGTYEALFGKEPEAFRVWRCVLLLRAVRDRLREIREDLVWRAASMAGYGDLLVTHVVFRQLDTTALSDPDADWDAQLARVPALVREALVRSLQAIDLEYGPTSHIIAAVRNTEKIRRVARAALRGMTSDEPAPELAADYQASTPSGRQVNAVKTLVEQGTIDDGVVLEYRPYTGPERREMADWLAEEPLRSQAVWRNRASNQLQWCYDDQWYSPSGLARKMRLEASGVNQAAQGTLRWFLPEAGSLAEVAERARAEADLFVGDEPGDGEGADAGVPGS